MDEFPEGSANARRLGFRTALSVPLMREGVAIGAIAILRAEAQPFTERQVALLETFADQAVIAIENVRLFNELQERTQELTRSVEELRALGEVGQAVSSSLDIQSVLTSIVSHAVELSQTDAGTIYEFDEAAQVFVPRANYGMAEELIEALRQSRIRRRRERDRAGGGDARRRPDPRPRARAELPAALHARGGVPRAPRGPAPAGGPRDRRAGGPAQGGGGVPEPIVDLLQTFATQSVIAIQNARLFREIDEKSRALEELSRNQEQLYRLSTALQEPLSLSEQLTRVLDAARQVVGLDRIYIWTLGPDGAMGSWSPPRPGFEERDWHDLAGVTIPIGEAGALAAVCRDGEPLRFTEDNPLPAQYRLRPPYSTLAGLRVKSFLVIPMIARGRTVGVLAADNRDQPRADSGPHAGPAPGLRRPGGRRRRERPAVPGDPGEESRARAREQAQVAVPRQHEPRAAHADERRAGLHRPHPGRHLRRRAARRSARRSSGSRPTGITSSA